MVVKSLLRASRVGKLARSFHATSARRAKAFNNRPFWHPDRNPMTFEEKFILTTMIGGSTLAAILLFFKEGEDCYQWAERIAERDLGPNPGNLPPRD
ncbi:hypothetical protein AAMO2058_000677500 [Amorphochlora amoebiformis]